MTITSVSAGLKDDRVHETPIERRRLTMPSSPAWPIYGVLIFGGFLMSRPIWKTYRNEGLRPAVRHLMWTTLNWLTIALLVTRPTTVRTTSLLRAVMSKRV